MIRLEPGAWGAWDGARRDAAADVNRALHWERRRADGAGKLADRERGVRVQDVRRRGGCRRWELRVALVVRAARALCRQDAGRFAERSCAEPARAELPALLRPAGLRRLPREKLWWMPRERPAARDASAGLSARTELQTAQARKSLELTEGLARAASARGPEEG